MTNLLHNTEKTTKKPRGKPFEKKDPLTGKIDPRINLKGAPPRGATIKDIYDFYDEQTADAIAEILPRGSDLQRMYAQMPKGIALKHLRVLRIFAAIMFEPTPGLLREVSDRTEGKVTTPIDVTTDGDKITKVEFDYGKLIGSVAPRPDEDPEAPSEDESGLHGETMGKDNTGGNAGAGSG